MKKIINLIKNRKEDLIWIMIFFISIPAIQAWQTRNLLSKHEKAPQFSLSSTKGEQINLSDYHGKPVVLYFFAPWCTVCKMTTGNVENLRKFRDEKNLEVIAIGSAFSNPDEIVEYKRNHDMNIPVLIGNEETSTQYQVKGFPTFYFIDADGNIESNTMGYTSTAGLIFRSL